MIKKYLKKHLNKDRKLLIIMEYQKNNTFVK